MTINLTVPQTMQELRPRITVVGVGGTVRLMVMTDSLHLGLRYSELKWICWGAIGWRNRQGKSAGVLNCAGQVASGKLGLNMWASIVSSLTDCHEATHRYVRMAHVAGCGSACLLGHFPQSG